MGSLEYKLVSVAIPRKFKVETQQNLKVTLTATMREAFNPAFKYGVDIIRNFN